MIYTITVAFAPAAQLARSLKQYEKNRSVTPNRHIVVMGHYPINKEKNNRDIKMICDAFGVECWDPGSDLGSAQSQNWALDKLNIGDDDYFINLDPDSNCSISGWDQMMLNVLTASPNCVLISCWSELWEPFKDRLYNFEALYEKFRSGWLWYEAKGPIPFNLSMFRCSFIKQIGGLRQMGEKWGELEAPFHAACEANGKHHAYLMDYVEEESGKFMQDKQLLEYKNRYMRRSGDESFIGTYEEFLRYKYPQLLEVDTFIPHDTQFE